VSEGAKEDKASWTSFLREMKQRGLKGVQLFVSDKCLGLVEDLCSICLAAASMVSTILRICSSVSQPCRLLSRRVMRKLSTVSSGCHKLEAAMLRLFQFIILTLALALVALTSAIVTMRLVIHGAEVKIPSFQGLTAPQARAKAAELGVEMSIDNRFYSAEVPAGRILSQSPTPGAVVRREWHVRCIESLGPQTVAIPNLTGQPQRAAIISLRRLGLEVGAVARMPSAAAPETVIAQDPPPGAAGVEKPSVALLISDPKPANLTLDAASAATYVMPDFTGRPYVTAAATITRDGLKLAQEFDSPATSTPENQPPPQPGTVVAQIPQAGYPIDPNTPIQLTVVR
jgi:eukaryotic-like serine/threonine-protein kinase